MAKYLLIKMARPPEIDKDVEKMIEKGVSVYLVEEDARERGLTDAGRVRTSP